MRTTRSTSRKQRIQASAIKTRDALFAALSPNSKPPLRSRTPSPILSLPINGLPDTPTTSNPNSNFETPPTIAKLEDLPDLTRTVISQSQSNEISSPDHSLPKESPPKSVPIMTTKVIKNESKVLCTVIPPELKETSIETSAPATTHQILLPSTATHPPQPALATSPTSPDLSSCSSSHAPAVKRDIKIINASLANVQESVRTSETDISFLRASYLASTSMTRTQVRSLQMANGRIETIVDTLLDKHEAEEDNKMTLTNDNAPRQDCTTTSAQLRNRSNSSSDDDTGPMPDLVARPVISQESKRRRHLHRSDSDLSHDESSMRPDRSPRRPPHDNRYPARQSSRSPHRQRYGLATSALAFQERVIHTKNVSLAFKHFKSTDYWPTWRRTILRLCATHPLLSAYVEEANNREFYFAQDMPLRFQALFFEALKAAIPFSIWGFCCTDDDDRLSAGIEVWNKLDDHLGLRAPSLAVKESIRDSWTTFKCNKDEDLDAFFLRFGRAMEEAVANRLHIKDDVTDSANFLMLYLVARSDQQLQDRLLTQYEKLLNGANASWCDEGFQSTRDEIRDHEMSFYTIQRRIARMHPVRAPTTRPGRIPGVPFRAPTIAPEHPGTPHSHTATTAPGVPQPPPGAPRARHPAVQSRFDEFTALISTNNQEEMKRTFNRHPGKQCYIHGVRCNHHLLDCNLFQTLATTHVAAANALRSAFPNPPTVPRTARSTDTTTQAQQTTQGNDGTRGETNTTTANATVENVNVYSSSFSSIITNPTVDETHAPICNHTTASPSLPPPTILPASSLDNASTPNKCILLPPPTATNTSSDSVPDSGSTHHMTGRQDFFSELHFFEETGTTPPLITLGDNKQHIPATGWGVTDTIEHVLRVKRVAYFVPALDTITLLSIKRHTSFLGCAFHAEANDAVLAYPHHICQITNGFE